VAIGYVHMGSQFDSTGLESDKLDEWNARIGIEGDNWRATIFGDNLTNERRALTRGALGVQPNLPRRIGARFSVDF
jgi:hypothetical protein